MANISAAHTALPSVVPIIMNMVLSGWLELVGDIGSEIFCDPPAVGSGISCDPLPEPGGGEDIEDVSELEGEDIGNGVEDDGEPETDF